MFELLKGFLLKQYPGPGFPFLSEQVKGGDNIGEIWNEFPVEVCEPSEGSHSCD